MTEKVSHEVEDGSRPILPQQTESNPEFHMGSNTNLNRWRNLGILLVMNTVSFVQAFDATCISVVLPALARELDASFSESLTMGSIFLLATAISQPIFAELSQVVGRRPAYIACLVIFIAGTALCGAAKSSLMLLAGRAVQGVGSGGPQALSGLILTDMFPARKRSQSMAIQNISWALGTIAGPLVGGAIVHSKDSLWRWIFWCTIPFLGGSLIGAMFLLGYDQSQRNCSLIKNLDWIGILLCIISSISLVLPLTWGGSRFPWESTQIIVLFGISALAFMALGVYERNVKRPMFPRSMFKEKSTILQFVNATIHGVLMWMVLYYLAVYFLGVKGQSPLMTGVWALPATITVAPMAAMVGLVAYRTGKYQGFLIGGWALLVAIFGVMTILDKDTPTAPILVITMFVGIAMGLLFPVMSIGVQATVKKEDVGHAVSMIYVLRTMGQCLGIALGIVVFSVELTIQLKSMGLDTAQVKNAMKMIKASVDQGDIEQGGIGQGLLMEAVSKALQRLWMTGSILAGLALILSLFTRCPKLPKDNEPASASSYDHGDQTVVVRIWNCIIRLRNPSVPLIVISKAR
ncbi:related to putative multidrug transporter [Fusarium torulosum]|uniref:Related to putative multidrug transporter n=1 Tax=Fusarium torulosum TaxID=33205 RepID=A0AAE8M7Y0_9HYPO|nr:related to putative multidrug transporter [Fusarium torulosum]